MHCTPIQEGGEPQYSDLTRLNVVINRHFLRDYKQAAIWLFFISKLCQAAQNSIETKLSKLRLSTVTGQTSVETVFQCFKSEL